MKKGLSRHPKSDQGVATELAWHSTAFLLAMLCAFTTLSLHFHGANNAFTALSRRSHCADGVLGVCLHNRKKSSSVVCLSSKLKPCQQKEEEEGRKTKCQTEAKARGSKSTTITSSTGWVTSAFSDGGVLHQILRPIVLPNHKRKPRLWQISLWPKKKTWHHG